MFARTAGMVIIAGALLGPAVADADYNDGVAAYHRGDFEAAEQEFAEAVKANRTYAGSHYMLGLCQERLGKTAEAVASLSEAVKLDPDNAKYSIGKARALNSDGQPGSAIEALAAVNTDSIDPDLRTSYALIFASAELKLGRNENALRVLEERLAEDASDPSLHRAAGMVFERLDRRGEAFEAYARACGLDPDDTAVCRAAVRSALAASSSDLTTDELHQILTRAVDFGETLARSSPTAEHLVLAGKTCLQAGQYKAAATWFEKATTAGVTDPLTLYYWGRSLASAGHRGGAAEKYETALQLEPDGSLAERIHGQLARLAECRLELEAAARHHRLAGNQDRADEMEKLATDYGNAVQRRRDLEKTIAGLRSTLPQLEELGDEAGQEAINNKIVGLERDLASIDTELRSVRTALAKSCPGG